MPNYTGDAKAKLLNTNTQAYLWKAETLVGLPVASVAFQLSRIKSASYPFGVSYELRFSGAPGAFQLDIQDADTDVEENYVTIYTQSSVNSNNAARIELPNLWTKFVRGRLVTLTNAVAITLKVTR